jgi:hypothetical protein
MCWNAEERKQAISLARDQLSTGAASLNAKIRKELAENKGSIVWSERRVKLFDCVSQKRRE